MPAGAPRRCLGHLDQMAPDAAPGGVRMDEQIADPGEPGLQTVRRPAADADRPAGLLGDEEAAIAQQHVLELVADARPGPGLGLAIGGDAEAHDRSLLQRGDRIEIGRPDRTDRHRIGLVHGGPHGWPASGAQPAKRPAGRPRGPTAGRGLAMPRTSLMRDLRAWGHRPSAA